MHPPGITLVRDSVDLFFPQTVCFGAPHSPPVPARSFLHLPSKQGAAGGDG